MPSSCPMNIPAGPHSPVTPGRRRTRNRHSACSRHRRHGGQLESLAVAGGDSTTPHSHWRLSAAAGSPEAGKVRRDEIGVGAVSSRKLAARLWRFRLAGGGGERDRLGVLDLISSPCSEHVQIKFPGHCTGENDRWSAPLNSPSKNNAIPHNVKHDLPDPRNEMEGATKWDPRRSISSDKPSRSNGLVKYLGDQQQVNTVPTVSPLQAELVQARLRIQELETEKRSCNKKVEHLLHKLSEEKSSWRRREHEKVRAIITDLNDQLTRESENRQRVEKLNSRLVTELANAKVFAKKLVKDYKEEKKARERMEEISNELAKEIGEDRAEMGAWKTETLKFQEELEKERKMLQMAEIWREERVQMKLVDAKLALEEKYCHMNKLIKELEIYLHTRNEALGARELRKAELMKQAARSVNIEDTNEFSYVPSKPDDMFSIIEELQIAEASKRGIGQHWNTQTNQDSPETDISEVCSISAEQSKQNTTPTSKHWNGEICRTNSESCNGRVSNGAISSMESGNSIITRELKKCVELPRGIHRNSLQARLLEARMESENYQSHCIS